MPAPAALARLDDEAKERDRRNEEARRKQLVTALATKLGRRYAPGRATLDSFVCDHAGQKAAVEAVRRFAAGIEPAVKDGRGLVLYGTVGTGKDHLLAALLYAAAGSGFSCSWVAGLELYGRVRDTFDNGRAEETAIGPHVLPDVLGISDPILPTNEPGRPQAWRTETLYRILDRRYREVKPTWVTINAEDADDAKAKLGAPDLRPAQGQRRVGPVLLAVFPGAGEVRQGEIDSTTDRPTGKSTRTCPAGRRGTRPARRPRTPEPGRRHCGPGCTTC
jgi:DNA replication protein DnaC